MLYDLTETQLEIIETSREVAEKKIKPVRAKYDETEEFPWDVIKEIKDAGLFGVYLPEESGGLGGGILELCLTVETLSQACGGIGLCVATSGLCAIPIILYGTPEQREKWIPDLASGEKLGAFCITEPGSGSAATEMKATAVKKGDYYILNGTKNFCSSGKVSETYTVFFSTNPNRGARGISSFIIPKGIEGFTFGRKEEKMGIRANPTYELKFDNCKIPVENLGGQLLLGSVKTGEPVL